MKIDTATEIFTTKQSVKKQYNKNLVVNLLELILTKKALMFLELSLKYLDTLNNRLTKLINKISTRLSRLGNLNEMI